MASENIRAVLDIGTTKITVLVGEMDEEGGIYIIGHGISPAEGLRRGVVVDMDKTVKSINKAIEDAQLVSGTEIDSVAVSISGEHIRSINSHGVIAVSRSDNEITSSDVNRAIDAARTVAIPVDREIIHVIPQEYSVDDQGGIKDPIGMSGVRLEVEAHLVTASVTTAKNIYRALERCHLNVDHIVLEALAQSQVLLSESDMEIGVVLLDIGGDITNIAVFHDGAIRHTGVISLGSRNITNDIAIGLRTPLKHAKELKIMHGCALASMVNPEDLIDVPTADGSKSKEVSRHVLASIIEPRMEEIMSLVLREIKRANITDLLTGGLILSGGGSMLSGTVELAEQLFDLPVRKGIPANIAHIPDELQTCQYSTAHGLLVYSFNNEPITYGHKGKVKGWMKKFEDWVTKKF
ncbi:MAG: cell division protein FtsA [candidate division Zixibacteria bacterium]|nr:cell division protein FtsA [candidate division Zixibacteria bacterium]